MREFLFGFWWLIFPLMGFVFGGFGMFMNYRMHRDRMDLLKTYAEKGTQPPPEVSQGMPPPADPYGYGYGYGGWYGWRGRWGRMGPYWEWRRFIIFTCLSIGFGAANYFGYDGDRHWGNHGHDMAIGFPFGFLAILFGVMAAGSLVFAILATVWRNK